MKGKKKIAGVFACLPVMNGLFLGLCFLIGIVTEKIEVLDSLYVIAMLIVIAGFIFSPIINIVMGILGLVFAGKAKKNGETGLAWIYVFGILDLIAGILCLYVAYVAIFVIGPSV